ncbi:MAG: Holliday junction resolvase YqgF, putative holliday junction resolvase [Candidatus Kaiserbacteria bacterium]|nr:Holliday junction resolvase YqgF, putative holliday junction resolvase [Candidatus Kaiserbacteria bacterium]
MRYLGIDYGVKRVGLAVSDAAGTIAFPRPTVHNDAKLFERLIQMVKDEKIAAVVVGDTRAFSGFENPVTREAESFMEKLRMSALVSVVSAWEAGSSVEASRYSPDDAHEDGAAAAIILQRYMDMHPSHPRSSEETNLM